MKVLVIAGHPDLATSVANKFILKEIQSALPEADVRYLCQLYPDGKIDVAAEQAALAEADLIVWQFPFNWFAMPALMKKWMDEVFAHGFAYGTGAKLAGKKFLISFTTGAPEAAYSGAEGSVVNINSLIDYYKSIAIFCGLDFQGYEALYGVSFANRTDPKEMEKQDQISKNFADKLVARIQAIG